MSMNWVKKPLLLVMALTVVACSSSKDEDKYIARDVDVLYNLGQDQLDRHRYRNAAAAFDEVERQHPHSYWSRRALLMSAYSHYMTNDYDSAINTAQRFLQLHPGNSSSSYAYYLIAMCHYELIAGVGRDQDETTKARKALIEVIRRFPDSKYALDSQLKLDLTNDHLAGKDMEVGRYYLDREEYLAAVMRFRGVIENYQTTSHAPEALHRLVEGYLALGVTSEAQTAAAVLGHNYPGSKWYRYSYALMRNEKLPLEASSDSWLSKIWPF